MRKFKGIWLEDGTDLVRMAEAGMYFSVEGKSLHGMYIVKPHAGFGRDFDEHDVVRLNEVLKGTWQELPERSRTVTVKTGITPRDTRRGP